MSYFGKTDTSGVLHWDSTEDKIEYIHLPHAYGEIYISSAADTTFSAANTPTKAAGTYSPLGIGYISAYVKAS